MNRLNGLRQNENIFFGNNLDDKRYQLNGKLSIYRSYVTTIRYRFEEWTYRNKYINIEIETFGERILFEYELDKNGKAFKDISGMIILLSDNAIINERRCVTIENVPELEFNILFPNGLRIETSSNFEFNSVEQKWIKSNDKEVKRIFYSNGCVIIYFNDINWKILTSNGAIYETITEDDYKEMTNELEPNVADLGKANDIYCDYLNFLVRFPAINLKDRIIRLTMANGCRYLIQNETIVSIICILMNYKSLIILCFC